MIMGIESAARCRTRIIAGLLAVAALTFWSGAAAALHPGDMAPPLIAGKWVRGSPVEHFEAGRVYVVDLWAMWCKPCLASMPGMRDLERVYADKATFVAFNIWEMAPERIGTFMSTFGDSMPGRVALDSIPNGKMGNEGLTAVAFTGNIEVVTVPRTFVVDQRGTIAWIGNPLELEEPLAAIVAGTWDLATFAAEYTAAAAAADSAGAGNGK